MKIKKHWQSQTKELCVYRLQLSDGSVYIGATKNFPERMRQHTATYLKKNLVFIAGIVDEFSTIEECSMMEQYYIQNMSTRNSTNSPKYKTSVQKSNFTLPKDISPTALIYAGKQGWCAMYKSIYDKVMVELTSKLETQVFLLVRDSFTKNKTEVHFNKTTVAKRAGSTRPTVSRIFKKFESLQAIRHIGDGVYRLNPYMFVPYQADGLRLQKEWDLL